MEPELGVDWVGFVAGRYLLSRASLPGATVMADRDRCRVLNIESNTGVRQARTKALLACGFEVAEAASGEEALLLAQANPFHVAVIDVHMPDIPGMELIRRLKSSPLTRSVQMLQISATATVNEPAIDSGADAYLTAPVPVPALEATVRALYRNYCTQADLRNALERERTARIEDTIQRLQLEPYLANVTDALAIFDHRGTVVSANDSFLSLHGISAPGDRERSLVRHDVFTADGRPLEGPEWPVARACAGEVVNDLQLCARDRLTGREWIGSYNAVPVRDLSGAILFVVVTVRDLSAQKSAERLVRQRELRFRALTEAAPVLLWICDERGRTTFQSAQWREFSGGLPASGNAGWMELIHPEDLRPATDDWNESLRTGETFQSSLRLRRFDGSFRWMAARASPYRDEQGAIVQWVGTCADIHEFKEMEEALRETTAALQRTNEELQQFAYFASHDLQEPLRTIRSFIDLLVSRYGAQLDAEPLGYLEQIGAGAERMKDMVAGLLEYSRAGSELWTDTHCDSSAAFGWAVENLRKMIAESDASVICGELPVVPADFGRLSRVLQNLISNAIKYRSDMSPEVTVTAVPDGGYWRFCVQDNGSGIPAESHERVFRIFKRLHGREIPGSGIGLAICRRIVERHGGRIWVESRPEGGCRFCFTVPRAEGAAARA